MQALCIVVFPLFQGVSEMMPWYCDWITCGPGHNAVCVYPEEALSIYKHEAIFGFFLRKMLVSWTKAGPSQELLREEFKSRVKDSQGRGGGGGS